MRNILLITLIFQVLIANVNGQDCNLDSSVITYENSDKSVLSTFLANQTFVSINTNEISSEQAAILVLDSASVILNIQMADDSDCINNYILPGDLFTNQDIHQFYNIAEINWDNLDMSLTAGQSIDSLVGCFSVSNSLRLNNVTIGNRLEIANIQSQLNPDDLNIFGGGATLNNILVSTTNRALDVCLIDSLNRSFNVLGAVGTDLSWVVTSRMGEVLDILDEPIFNFSSYALRVESNPLLHEIELFHISRSGGEDWLSIGDNIKSDLCGSATRNQTARFDINFIDCENTCEDGFLNGEEVESVDNCVNDSLLVCNIINIDNVSCFGFADGSAEVELTSGFGPFHYEWETGDTTATVQNLSPGTYRVTVSDEGNKMTECIAAINQPDSLEVNITITFGVSCSASAAVTGGLEPYTYAWSTGDDFISITGIDTLHSVTVTDRNSCTATATMSAEMLSAACGNCSDGIMNGNEIGIDCGGECDPCPVDTVNMNPLQLSKAASFVDENNNGFAELGETINYLFSVCNAGTTQLTQITIEDPIITVTGGPVILEAGACDASSFSGVYTITEADLAAGMIMNQATATGMISDTIMVVDLSDDPNNQNNTDTESDGEPDDPTIIAIEDVGECGVDNLDTDDDGICDALDEDDDGDGVNDVDDAFPFDSFETVDTDNDGFGNNSDADDDNDGVDDRNDAFPLDATESLDTDGDGVGDNADQNDDGDDCDDLVDTDPLVASADCMLDLSCDVALGNDSLIVFSGNIQTDIGIPVDSAIINITRVGDNLRIMTDTIGDYNSSTLPTLFNYQIRPEKRDLPFLGTSTLDMLFVQRHILRLGQLETPYKIIAADVSGNQEISIVDIIVMRRMILGIVDEWNDGVEWKFVDVNTSFFDPAKPWPFNRTIEIPNATDSSCDNNFIGIKVGDVDNSYEASETRNNVGQTLQYSSSVTAYGSVVYSFSLQESSTVFGFQFSLDQIEDTGFHIESDVIDISHDHFNIDNQNAHVSWTNPYGQYVKANEILFTIEIAQAKTELQLNESKLKSEIYSGENIDAKHLILEHIHDADQSHFSITPNPFTDNVFVQLKTKQFSHIEVNIFTIDGQRVWNLSEQYQAGNQQIEIPGSVFNSSGMYYYSVSVDGENYTGKIVKE